MKKKIIALILIIMLLSVCLCACDKPTEGLKFELNADKNGYIVMGVDNKDIDKIVIPKTFNDIDVVAIADNAFSNHKKIEYVKCPNTIKKIGKYAFSGCEKLKEVSLSKNLQELGYGAFFDCNLDDIDMKSNEYFDCENNCLITKNGVLLLACKKSEFPTKTDLTEIEDCAFKNINFKKEISFPNTLKRVGKHAFENSNIKTVIVNKNLENIGECAFKNSKLKNIWIKEHKNNKLNIKNCAFSGCNDIIEIIISKQTVLGSYVFEGWSESQRICCEDHQLSNDWAWNWNDNTNAKILWGCEIKYN